MYHKTKITDECGVVDFLPQTIISQMTMTKNHILILLLLVICFAGTGSVIFSAENKTVRTIHSPLGTTITRGYSMKHSLSINNDAVYDIATGKPLAEFSQKTNLEDYIIDGTAPNKIYPFDFTNDGEYVCYYLDYSNPSSHPKKNRIQLRDCATAEIVKLFPAEWKSEYDFTMLPRSPVISPDKKMIVFLVSKELDKSVVYFTAPSTLSYPQKYLLFFDWERGEPLDYVKTAGTQYTYTSYSAYLLYQERVPKWPEKKEYYRNDLILFTLNSQKVIIRASDHQVDLYNLSTRLIERSFNLASIAPGFKENMSTFEWTDDTVLRINLISNSNYPLQDINVTNATWSETPYIDWDIETGEIVRKGGILFPTD